MRTTVSVLTAAAVALSPLAVAAPAQAQSGNPLNSIFGCASSGNKQAGGALAGAVVGGILGNQVSGKKNKTTGTVVGAALGAAAGSYVGCRMQRSDQAKAEAAAQLALQNGETASWSNPETGASGRTTVVSSRGGQPRERPQPVSLQGVRFAPGVEPTGSYTGASGSYEAPNRVNLRGTPSTDGRVIARMNPGETFEALARVRGGANDWLLAGRNGIAIGYVSETVVRPLNQTYANAGPVCRTFDQTLSTGRGETETNRYTACQTASGEWVVQS